MVLERMLGLSLPGIIAAASQGRVTDRTVRNWINQKTSPSQEHIEALAEHAEQAIRHNLTEKQWPIDEREQFVAAAMACPGIVSSMAHMLQAAGGQYPMFCQQACDIDLLEIALAERRQADDVGGWVETLLNTAWIVEEHLVALGPGHEERNIRQQMLDAKSWAELELPASVIAYNLQFQLLATLDIEFCSCYLGDLKATPTFAALLPLVDARVELAREKTIPMIRDVYRYPIRRLLDATACMRAMRGHPSRKWPQQLPPVEEMGIWLDLAGERELAGNLLKWRCGRPLTANRFNDIWEACFSSLGLAEPPPAPMPMMYAATVFTAMFVIGSREKRQLTFVSPDPAWYLRWWDIEHARLANGPNPPRFGVGDWSEALSLPRSLGT